jgi:hypothetical protein
MHELIKLVICAVITNTSLLLPTLTPASEAHPTRKQRLHLSFFLSTGPLSVVLFDDFPLFQANRCHCKATTGSRQK